MSYTQPLIDPIESFIGDASSMLYFLACDQSFWALQAKRRIITQCAKYKGYDIESSIQRFNLLTTKDALSMQSGLMSMSLFHTWSLWIIEMQAPVVSQLPKWLSDCIKNPPSDKTILFIMPYTAIKSKAKSWQKTIGDKYPALFNPSIPPWLFQSWVQKYLEDHQLHLSPTLQSHLINHTQGDLDQTLRLMDKIAVCQQPLDDVTLQALFDAPKSTTVYGVIDAMMKDDTSFLSNTFDRLDIQDYPLLINVLMGMLKHVIAIKTERFTDQLQAYGKLHRLWPKQRKQLLVLSKRLSLSQACRLLDAIIELQLALQGALRIESTSHLRHVLMGLQQPMILTTQPLLDQPVVDFD